MSRKSGILLSLGLAATLFATAAVAQTPPSAPAPSARQVELAHRYIQAVHMDQMMDGMMKQMMPAIMAGAPKDSSLTEAQRQAISDVSIEVTRELMSKVMARMEPVMAETFSEKELSDLVAFYEGPTGQSMLAKMPVMMGKIAPMMADLMPQMQSEMRTKICARIDCAGAGKAAASKPS